MEVFALEKFVSKKWRPLGESRFASGKTRKTGLLRSTRRGFVLINFRALTTVRARGRSSIQTLRAQKRNPCGFPKCLGKLEKNGAL